VEGTEVVAAGRFAWSPFLATTLLNLTRRPAEGQPRSDYVGESYDYQLLARQRVFGDGEVRVLGFGLSDYGGQRSEGDSILLGDSFHRADVRFTLPVGGGRFLAGVTGGLDSLHVNDAGGPASKFSSRVGERMFAARTEYAWPLFDQLELRVGGDVERRFASLDQVSRIRPGTAEDPDRPVIETAVEQSLATATFAGAFVEADYRHGALRVAPGLRLDSYDSYDRTAAVVLEPRLLAGYAVNDALSVRASAGLHHQAPAYLVELPAAAAVNVHYGLQRAFEVNVGSSYAFANGSVSLDVFARPDAQLHTLSIGDLDFLAPDLALRAERRVEQERAFGAELAGELHPASWVRLGGAYSFVHSVRTGQVERHNDLGEVIATETASYASPLAQAHIVNLTAQFVLPAGFTAATTLHFNSGAAEAGDLSSFTQRAGVDASGATRWHPADRDRVATLPAFWRLDARISKRWDTRPVQWEAWLDVLNVSLQREVFRYSYGVKAGTLERNPFGVPPITLPFVAVKATLL
jgi:hypothetical protein